MRFEELSKKHQDFLMYCLSDYIKSKIRKGSMDAIMFPNYDEYKVFFNEFDEEYEIVDGLPESEADLKEEKSKLREEKAKQEQAEASLIQAQAEVARLKADLKATVSREEYQALEKELDEKTQAYSKLSQANSQLKAELDKSKDSIAGLNTSIDSIEKEREQAQAEVDRLKAELKVLDSENQGNIQENTTLKEKLASKEAALKDLEAGKKDLEEQIKTNQEALKQSRADLGKAQEEITGLKTEQESKDKEIEKLTSEIAELKKANGESGKENTALKEELASKEAALEKLEADKEKLGKQIQTSQKELNQSQTKLTQAQKEITSLKTEQESKDKEIVDLTSQIAELKKANGESGKENTALKEKLASKEAALKDLEAGKRELEAEKADLESNNESLETKVKDLEAKIKGLEGSALNKENQKLKIEIALRDIEAVSSFDDLGKLDIDEDIKKLEEVKDALETKEKELLEKLVEDYKSRIKFANKKDLKNIKAELAADSNLESRNELEELIEKRSKELEIQENAMDIYKVYRKLEIEIEELMASLDGLEYIVDINSEVVKTEVGKARKGLDKIDNIAKEKNLGDMTVALGARIEYLEKKLAEVYRKDHKSILDKELNSIIMGDRSDIEKAQKEYEELSGSIQTILNKEKEDLDGKMAKVIELEKAEALREAKVKALAEIEETYPKANYSLSIEEYRKEIEKLNGVENIEDLDKEKAEVCKNLSYLLADERLELRDELEDYRLKYGIILAIETIEIGHRDLIESGVEGYNDLSEASKAELKAFKLRLDKFLGDIGKLEKDVKSVEEQIAALGEISLDSKEAVEAARDAYDNLTDEQKDLVDSDKITKLADALEALEELEDSDKELKEGFLRELKTLIDELKRLELDASKYEGLDKESSITDIKVAIDEINKILGDRQNKDQAIIAELDKYKKEIIEKIDSVTSIEDLKGKIKAILKDTEVKFEVREAEYEGSIEYEVILSKNSIERKFILSGELPKTEDERIAREVEEKISNLPEKISLGSKGVVEVARGAFDKLTEEQKKLVNNLETLEVAEARIKELEAAKGVEDQIAVLGEITLDSKEAVEAARVAYQDLTEDQKELVTNIKTLKAAEASIKELEEEKAEADKKAAKGVEDQIGALGEISLDSKEAVEAARVAYDNLTAEQKELVTNLGTLTAAEAKIKELEEAKAVEDQIGALGEITLDSKEAVEAARAAYDNLTAEQKELVTNLGTLTAAETKIIELEKIEEDLKALVALLQDSIDGYSELEEKTRSDLKKVKEFKEKLGAEFKLEEESEDKLTKLEEEFSLLDENGYSSKIGDRNFISLEKALEESKAEDLVIVLKDYSLKKDVEVKEGVTLLLPFDNTLSDKTNSFARKGTIKRNEEFVRLILEEGKIMDVNGKLIVNAMRDAATPTSGYVTGDKYSILELKPGSKVNINNKAHLDVNGFIIGDGKIEAHSGSSVTEALSIYDFRGGRKTLRVSVLGKNTIFPFDQFSFNQIESKIKINTGVSYRGDGVVYGGSGYQAKDIELLGDKDAPLKICEGYIMKTMDSYKSIFDINGIIDIQNASVAGVSLKGKDLPFAGNYKFIVRPGSEININSGIKLLPGSDFTVEEGAKLNINKEGKLMVYYNNEYDYNHNGSWMYPIVGYDRFYRLPTKLNYGQNDRANLKLDGELNVYGGIAGVLSEESKGKINISSDAKLDLDVNHSPGDKDVKVLTQNYRLRDKDGKEFEENKSYKIIDGVWKEVEN